MKVKVGDTLQGFWVANDLGNSEWGQDVIAVDPDSYTRVKVRIVDPQWAEIAGFRTRFEAGMRKLERFQHRNILQVFETDIASAQCSVTMEEPKGFPLGEWRLHQNQPTLDALGMVFQQIVEAVVAAHDQGIAHGRLSPSCIFVTADGRASVQDFGWRDVVQQAQGAAAAADWDPTEDIRALGRMAYFLCTAQYPNDAQSFDAPGAWPRPSQLNPAIPSTLDLLIVRMMGGDPTHPFTKAEDLRGIDISARQQVPGAPEPPQAIPPDMRNFHAQMRKLGWVAVASGLVLGLATIWYDGLGILFFGVAITGLGIVKRRPWSLKLGRFLGWLIAALGGCCMFYFIDRDHRLGSASTLDTTDFLIMLLGAACLFPAIIGLGFFYHKKALHYFGK